MRKSFVRLVATTLAVLPFAASCSLRTSGPPTRAEVARQLDRLAVPFVENAGQSDPRVAYYARAFSGPVFVTRQGELVYALPARRRGEESADAHAAAAGWTLTESFVGGRGAPVASQPAATRVSDFVGNDPMRWQPIR